LVISSQATTNPLVGEIFRYLSVAYHYEGFLRGVVNNYNLAYYVSFIGMMLMLTKKSLDARNW
ncbi:MAG: hypothetical protein L3J74_05210, partial [Bacteroidales bacterium]|nr:hypothetical protein [Bacteroidales bacterium]